METPNIQVSTSSFLFGVSVPNKQVKYVVVAEHFQTRFISPIVAKNIPILTATAAMLCRNEYSILKTTEPKISVATTLLDLTIV